VVAKQAPLRHIRRSSARPPHRHAVISTLPALRDRRTRSIQVNVVEYGDHRARPPANRLRLQAPTG